MHLGPLNWVGFCPAQHRLAGGARLVEPATRRMDRRRLEPLALARFRGEGDRFQAAPVHAPRRRLDETRAARQPVLRWTKPEPV